MDPALWELLRAEAGADGDRELETIIRLARPGIEIPDIRIVSRFGAIATCRIRARDIVPVRARHDVVSLKAARGLSPGFEPAIGAAVPDALGRADFRPADVRRSPGLTLTSKGVVVASVDWGVDVDSAAFRWRAGPAAAGGDRPAGGTRFLSLWDQRDLAAGPRPDPYGYGTVHDREQIDRALHDPRPYERLGYHPAIADRGGHGTHGTHVLDIAAGNGQAGGPAGIAPEADLIFVHLADRTTGGLANLGDSVRLLEAVDFISRKAGSQPCVINISAGRTCGPKDGTTLVERALDELLAATPGRFVVNSAGNYFGWRTHSCGRIAPGESRSLTFVIDPADITLNELEIWYDGADEFAVRIDPPGYAGGRAVRLGERSDLLIEGRAVGRVYHRKHDPNNGDNHIVAYIDPIARAGNWTVTLEARQVNSGRFHAWIERDDTCRGCQARFTPADSNPVTTIGTITTSRLPLIVGAYDGHDPARPVAPFSSSGPSRDLRPKPDLVAPGVDVLAARSASTADSHNPGLLVRKSGTSMATPHVTGAVALCLEAAGNTLSARQIRSLILGSCDPAPDPDTPHRFGRGYLNIPRLIADLQRTLTAPDAKEPTMNTDDSIVLLTAAPATAYREYLYRPRSQLARWIDSRFDVVARPGQRLDQAPELGDVLLEITLGRVKPGRCLVLKAHDPELEVSPRRLPAGQLLLRPRKRAEMSEPLPVEPTVETEGSNPAADVAAGAPTATAAAPPPTRIDGMDLNTGPAKHPHVFPPIADLRADGIQFAMLKATEGRDFRDASFYNRRATAHAEHFLSGSYHYYRGDVPMLPQADYLVTSVARLLPGDLPPAFDFEKGRRRPTTPDGDGAAAAGLRGAQWLAPLESFFDRVETGLGRTPMMYTSHQVWSDYVKDDPAFARFGDYPLWVKYQQDPATDRYARRLTLNPRLPAPWNDWAIWQYSLDYTPSDLKNLHHADPVTDLDVSNGGIHVLRGLANLGRPAPHGNGVRFVAHADENGVIKLLTSVGFWLESSLSDLAQSGGTARPLAAGDVTACDLGDRQFVAFRERSNGHLYEIERQNGTFPVVDITSVTGTTNAAGDPTYVTLGSDRHLVCRGDDDHQYLFSNIANRAWQARDVTAGAGIANASGQATAYVFGGDVHVVGRAGADGHLVEAWHDGTAWNVVDRTTAGVPAATYQPSTYLGTDGFVRVVYRAVRGAIHESDHHVTDLDLAQAAGGAPTAAGSPVSVMAGQVPHIVYRRTDGFLHEIFWNGAAWAHGQLPCLERAVADPAVLVTAEAGAPVLVVTFRRRDGAMQEVALRGGAWRCEAIEPVPNKPPADSDSADGDAPPWTGSPEQLAFRDRVLEAHLALSRQRRAPQRDLSQDELERVPGTDVMTARATALAAGRLLAAANADLRTAQQAGDSDALHTLQLTVTSGYRSSQEQRTLWLRYFSRKDGYYDRTRTARGQLADGPHSEQAIAYLLRPKTRGGFGLAGRIAAPGYSNHQGGIAVDFLQKRAPGYPVANDSGDAARARWRATWFHRWLIANAAGHGFRPLPTEEWHWEYRPASSPPATPASMGTVGDASAHDVIRFAQQVINAVAGGRLADDGNLGPLTRAALERFRVDNGLGTGGVLDARTDVALLQRALEHLAQASMFAQVGNRDAATDRALTEFKAARGLGAGATLDAATRHALADALAGRTTPSTAGDPSVSEADDLGQEEDTAKIFAPPTIPNLSGNTASSRTITWGGRSVEVHYFPGTSGQTVLILGGVHQDERKALALSNELLKQLQSSKDKPFNNIIFIPDLFGGRNTRENSIGGIPANRNSPTQDESLADSAKRGNGVPKDAIGRNILPENVILFALVETVKPRASLSLHSHRPITDPKEIVEHGAASVTVDPRPGGEEVADYLTKEMALAANNANVPVPGNLVTGDTARTRYPTEWAKHEAGVTFGRWGSHRGGMNQYLIETEGKPWPDHPGPSQQAEISGWTQVIWSKFLANPRDVTETTLARDLAKEWQALSGMLNW